MRVLCMKQIDFPMDLVGSNQPLKSWALCISPQARRIGAEPGTSSSLEPQREQVTGPAQLPAGQRAIAEPTQGHSVGLSPASPAPTARPWVPGDGAVGRRGAGTQGCSTTVACRRCFLTCVNATELISPAGLLMIWCNYELLQLTGSCSPPGSMSLGEECHHQSDGGRAAPAPPALARGREMLGNKSGCWGEAKEHVCQPCFLYFHSACGFFPVSNPGSIHWRCPSCLSSGTRGGSLPGIPALLQLGVFNGTGGSKVHARL